MLRVTITDLSRLPPERLAKLLLEWAARDRTLLSRLHGTIAEDIPAPVQPEPAPGPAVDAASHVDLVGDSAPMRQLTDMIVRYARTEEPVLITGESGTGKELAARAIHQRSSRASGPFAAVNCAAIPPSLIASELFGYEKGAFTGALARARGQIEHANGGTLFLDEIGDMPVDLQGYLLRFLQEGQIVRVGGREPIDVDVRVVAATNVRLRQAISEGRFREDLYYRLNVLALEIPPLRDRPDDIELLAHHFLREAAGQYDRAVTGFADDALAVLRQYRWPGNVRELMSAVRRAVVIGHTSMIERTDLTGLEIGEAHRPVNGDTDHPINGVAAPIIAQAAVPRPVPGSAEERTLLLGVLAGTGENIALTARELRVSRVTLYRMLRRHRIVPSRGFNARPGVVGDELDGETHQPHPDGSSAR
jgi:transcriptional regulator with PAS, ATPase and Fis domain